MSNDPRERDEVRESVSSPRPSLFGAVSSSLVGEWPDWADVRAWAARLVETVAGDHPSQHVAVFVADGSVGGLRLAGQAFGANEDTGAVVVGEWVVPFEGSVCGRVYRTGVAALVADVSLDPDYRSFPGGSSRSSLTVPVGPAGDVVAVINVEAPWVGAFSVRDYDGLTDRSSAAFLTFPRREVA